MMAAPTQSEIRVLVLSPLPRDLAMARDVLTGAGFEVEVFKDIGTMVNSITYDGAGMLLVAAEALFSREVVSQLTGALHNQPAWSDLPVTIITHSRIADPHELRAVRGLEHLHSVTFLDRPLRIAALVSTVRAALQARNRQYQVRDLLKAAEDGMRQRDEFLAMLSHELRNPLASISNAVHVLQLAPQRTSKLTEVLGRQVGLLSRMVDDLLDVGRITSGKVTLKEDRFDIAEPLRDAIETVDGFIQSCQHRLEVVTCAEPLLIQGDPARLAQVFANLLHNAAKYTPPGGTIQAEVSSQKGHAVFCVRDSGMGIEPEQLNHIFDLFAQAERSIDRHEGGLGVGLTVARSLVEMHGGTISARSEGAGKGSEFRVELPLATRRPDSVHGALASSMDRSCKVLVVDDNPEVADGLALLVETLGHEVRTVYHGSEVMAYARDYRPDVVFLDLGMPEMDGYSVARALRALPGRNHICVVALTGYGDAETVIKCHAAGFDQHLLKPADLQSLQDILHSPRRSAANARSSA